MSYSSASTAQTAGSYVDRHTFDKRQVKVLGARIFPASFISNTTIADKMAVASSTPIETTDSANTVCLHGVTIPTILNLNILTTLLLKEPLQIVLEPDDNGFIVRTTELPLYGFGDNPNEAIDNLKIEIETLYSDLSESDNFSEEWLNYKKYLSKIIIG